MNVEDPLFADDDSASFDFEEPLEYSRDGKARIAEHNAAVAVGDLVEKHHAFEQAAGRLPAPSADAPALPQADVGTVPTTTPRYRFGAEGEDFDAVLAAPRRSRPRGTVLQERTRYVAAGDFPDDDDLRLFLAERASIDFAELVRPTPAGRLTADERERRNELARVVKLTREKGAGFEQLARVLGRSLATVHALARHAA